MAYDSTTHNIQVAGAMQMSATLRTPVAGPNDFNNYVIARNLTKALLCGKDCSVISEHYPVEWVKPVYSSKGTGFQPPGYPVSFDLIPRNSVPIITGNRLLVSAYNQTLVLDASTGDQTHALPVGNAYDSIFAVRDAVYLVPGTHRLLPALAPINWGDGIYMFTPYGI